MRIAKNRFFLAGRSCALTRSEAAFTKAARLGSYSQTLTDLFFNSNRKISRVRSPF